MQPCLTLTRPRLRQTGWVSSRIDRVVVAVGVVAFVAFVALGIFTAFSPSTRRFLPVSLAPQKPTSGVSTRRHGFTVITISAVPVFIVSKEPRLVSLARARRIRGPIVKNYMHRERARALASNHHSETIRIKRTRHYQGGRRKCSSRAPSRERACRP